MRMSRQRDWGDDLGPEGAESRLKRENSAPVGALFPRGEHWGGEEWRRDRRGNRERCVLTIK